MWSSKKKNKYQISKIINSNSTKYNKLMTFLLGITEGIPDSQDLEFLIREAKPSEAIETLAGLRRKS